MTVPWRQYLQAVRPALRQHWRSKPPSRHAKASGLFLASVFNAMCAWHLLLRYVGGPTQMHGPSMLPTMSESGDLCWEWNLPTVLFGPSTLRRGQLVTFTSPLDPSRTVCKRLVGLPGDIVCVDPTGLKAPSTEHVVVPRHHMWVAGDNAAMSRDSRDYGPLHMGLLRGRIVARILPLRDFKIFDNTWVEVD